MNVSSGDLFDEKEQAVLKYAEQLTTKANVDASVVKELKLFLNEKQLVTLAAAVALANFTNRINHGLDIELP
jgi:alkylhydroperoxidase family enzyme